jgi:hypothetical protein
MTQYRKYALATGLLAAFLFSNKYLDGDLIKSDAFVSSAEARIGRPLTPRSVAGVARRTTRRVVRRSAIYVAALPAACVRVSINGAAYWQCGGTYYQSSGGRYVVVYIN